MPVSQSKAVWNGDLKSGRGTMSVGKNGMPAPFGFKSRFEGGEGYNPEELIGAAHAGCFSMALSNKLSSAGAKVNSISTTADVKLEKTDDGFSITAINLFSEIDVENADSAHVARAVEETKNGCPVSKALSAVPLNVTHRLVTRTL